MEEYICTHDPRSLGIEGARLTKSQIISAAKRKDIPQGIVFKRDKKRFIVEANKLVEKKFSSKSGERRVYKEVDWEESVNE